MVANIFNFGFFKKDEGVFGLIFIIVFIAFLLYFVWLFFLIYINLFGPLLRYVLILNFVYLSNLLYSGFKFI